MAELFTNAVDICNRACQHCGVRRIQSFTDGSKQALETQSVYDKLRRAELRRNVWTFAVRRQALRAIDWHSMQLTPATWSLTKIYIVGSIVRYNGLLYMSLQYANLNLPPDANPGAWTQFFGPMTVQPWVSPQTPPVTPFPGWVGNGGYYAGELVYYPIGENYTVYMSLVNGNTTQPGVFPAWSNTTIYNGGDTVSTVQVQIESEPGGIPVFSNPGNIPLLLGSGNWQCVKNLNVGVEPGTDTTSWVSIPIANQPDTQNGWKWLQLDATVSKISFLYPVGAGPLSQTTTRNVFQLPNGYLREAPQNPKVGSIWLGAPAGIMLDDYEKNGNFIVSSYQGPILWRFVADIADVTQMDDMFCEGLGARIGLSVVQELTQAPEKFQEISQSYKLFMGEARTVNAIEQGWTDPPIDDYIACRL